jgi:hypothetical protein
VANRWTVTWCLKCGAITAHDPRSELWPLVCIEGGDHGPTQTIEVSRFSEELHIVFDGPPGPESGRFVEVEDAQGRSFKAGEWRERSDGLWELVINA